MIKKGEFKILHKILTSYLIFVCILVLGCSKQEIVGYTYNFGDESNLVRIQFVQQLFSLSLC